MFALQLFGSDPGGLAAIGLALFFGALLLGYLVQLLVCWFVYNAALPIPAEHREIQPALAFLLLVPVAGTFLNFLVQPAVSRSYKRWFAARGVTTEGDCGENLAWWYAIAGICAWVPCLPFAGLAALVLQILYLVRLGRVRAAGRALALA
jgi:hypothetical protein